MRSRSIPLLVACTCFIGCGTREHPPALQDSDSGAPMVLAQPACVDDASTSTSAPPGPDAQGLCGNTFLKATRDPPNIYFVIDRSGSMHDFADGQEKYSAVANASVKLVEALGAQANVGAAVFPGHLVSVAHPCLAGEQVFPTTPGDLVPVGACQQGPTTSGFSHAVILPWGEVPNGSTPTAATLTTLLPTLTALPGKTFVILATDGGPNCNVTANCGADKCIPNIENVCFSSSQCCDAHTNCCDPSLAGPEACLDEEPTARAVADLLAQGIKTYVIGVPGSSPYAALLNRLALAGGTARTGGTAYYDVEHVTDLDDVLESIGSTVVLSCHVHLDAPPPALGFVNVYLDRQILTFNSPDGWAWGAADSTDATDAGERDGQSSAETDESSDLEAEAREGTTTEAGAETESGASPDADTTPESGASARQDLNILGAACESLESGKVRQIQVTFGCATEIAK